MLATRRMRSRQSRTRNEDIVCWLGILMRLNGENGMPDCSMRRSFQGKILKVLHLYQRYYVTTLIMCLRSEMVTDRRIAHTSRTPVLPRLRPTDTYHLAMPNSWILPPTQGSMHIHLILHPLPVANRANLRHSIFHRIYRGHLLNPAIGKIWFLSCHHRSFQIKASVWAHHLRTCVVGCRKQQLNHSRLLDHPRAQG